MTIRKKIPTEVIEEWAAKETYVRNRLNRINKRLKKYTKQKNHFELRLRLLLEHKKENDRNKNGNDGNANG